MPNYDMLCENCNNEFEKFFSYDDLENELKPKPVACPNCKSKKTRKIIKSSVPVIYKTRGFTKKVEGGE